MELDAVGPNDRATIGGNKPPEDQRTTLEQLAKDLRATGSAWVNEVQEITTKEQADLAAAFKKQCGDLVKRADAAKDKEKRPHLDANAAIEKHWKAVKAMVDVPLDVVTKKLTKWLIAEDARIKAEAAEAQRIADEKDQLAAIEADRATEIMMKAERGELAGTRVNTMAAIEVAEKANAEAEEARETADRLANTKAKSGSQFVVGGVKRSVYLKEAERVVIDLPSNMPPKVANRVTVAALQKIIPFIEEHGELADLSTEIGRLVNAIYRKSKAVAPGCKVEVTRSAV